VGLFQILGANNDNPRLDKNGSGKSTLLDSISFCCYGKTTRGLRGPDVINDNSDSCSVCVNLDIGQENLTIKTTQNPNSLTANNHITDRDSLAKRLRLNYDSFLYSIIIPQIGVSFLDLTPSLKLNLFSQILDLDYWLDKSNEAQNQVTVLESKKNTIEREISILKGNIESTKSTVQGLKVKASEWDQQQKYKWMGLQQEALNKAQRVESYKNDIEDLDKIIAIENRKIKNYETEISDYNNRMREFDNELTEANKEINLLKFKTTSLKGIEVRLKGVGSVCPTCNQDVDQQHLVKELSKIEKDLKKLNHERSEYNLVIDEIKEDKNNIKLEMSGTSMQANQCILEISKAKEKRDEILNEVKYLKREIEGTEIKLQQLKIQKNEFVDLVDVKEKELINLIEKVTEKESEINSLNEDLAAVSFWISGFKQLRLHIVEETLRSLEIEVNNCLEQLGLVGWTIEFDIERETKSGGISKGFNTFIKDAKGTLVKYERLSGGEGQRARLAVTFGLSNLIMERAGFICKTEFFDELSQHLSDAGVDDMLTCLKERAINQNKQLWVVDHRSSSFSDFDGQLTVTKDTTGSRIE